MCVQEQTAGSISSLEGFSPGSHSGETNHLSDGGRGGLRRKVDHPEEEDWPIPWILIPITGLSPSHPEADLKTGFYLLKKVLLWDGCLSLKDENVQTDSLQV